MVSPITQAIGPTVAQAVQPQQVQSERHSDAPNQAQLAQVSQAASERAAAAAGVEDKKRTSRIPKQVESPFGVQVNKKKAGQHASEEEKEENSIELQNPPKGSVDVVA